MPTNLERALAKKLVAGREEAKFSKLLMLACLGLCFINITMVIESPAYAAAVIWGGELD